MRYTIVILFVIILFCGCEKKDSIVGPTQVLPTSVSKQIDSVLYTLVVSKTNYNISDTLKAFLTAQNISKDTNKTFWISFCREIPWTVTNKEGKIVMTNQSGDPQLECYSGYLLHLTPGRSFHIQEIQTVIPRDSSVVGTVTLKIGSETDSRLTLSLNVIIH